MACTDPLTISPGFLRLDYLHSTQSLSHSTRARLVFGVDPTDVALMGLTALDWAVAWRGIVPPQFVCGGYSVLRHDGSLMYSNSFGTATAGTHAVAGGALDYASRTLAFTGRGIAGTAVECSGEEIGRVFVGGAYEFIPRQKFMVPGADAAVDAYAVFLEDSTVIWADEFGNKAGIRPRYPVQFNAHAQGRNGT